MLVAVIVGGRSDESTVTRISGENICRALIALGHRPVVVEAAPRGWTAHGKPVMMEPGRGLASCQVVFPLVAGLQSLLEVLDIPYVGPGAFAASLTGHKKICKDLMKSWGFPQVRYLQWNQDLTNADLEDLGLPLFVKPARLGSSIGITKVASLDQLTEAISTAASHDPLVLIEEAVEAIELEIGVMGFAKPVVSEVGQVLVSPNSWNDYDNKYSVVNPRLVVPAEIPASVAEWAQRLAGDCYARLGCSGGARVDLFYLTEKKSLLINEVNSSPMYTPTSAFPLLWQASGLELPEVVGVLLDTAFERHQATRDERF